MKILHFSQQGFPHWRVEKSAITGLNNGHRVFFAGIKFPESYNDPIFEKSYEIEWPSTNYPKILLFPYFFFGKPSIWLSVKNSMKRILDELKPDVVHAHNLISAKLISELNFPLVYNDHEYWSHFISRKYEPKIINKKNHIWAKIKNPIYKRIINVWSKWEENIVTKYPTLVVSRAIADEMKKKYSTKQVFVLPNFPLKNENPINDEPTFHKDLTSVYTGNDSFIKIRPHRDMTGLDKLFEKNDIGNLVIIGNSNIKQSEKIIVKGLLDRINMYTEMSKSSIGILPWKTHWSHKYFSPNKAFEYAHAGLHIICTSSLSSVVEELKNNCTTIENYNDLVKELSYFRNNKDELFKNRVITYNFAKENLIWEKYDKRIIEAYKSI